MLNSCLIDISKQRRHINYALGVISHMSVVKVGVQKSSQSFGAIQAKHAPCVECFECLNVFNN